MDSKSMVLDLSKGDTWLQSVSGFKIDDPELRQQYIRKVYISFAFRPALTGAVIPSSQPDDHSTLLRIIDQGLRSQCSIPEIAHGMAQGIESEIPKAVTATVEVRTHFAAKLNHRLLSSDFIVGSYAFQGTNQTKFARDVSRTRWDSKVALRGESAPRSLELTLEFSWPASTVDDHHRLAITYATPARYDCPFPGFQLHLKAADFVESKIHQSFDILAFELAGMFFRGSESIIGSSPQRAFALKINDQWSLPDGSPRPKTNYVFRSGLYESLQQDQKTFKRRKAPSRVFIALGSNIGNRIGMIQQACTEMGRRGLIVRHSSSLYETQAMYKTDQQPFINGACEVETTLTPLELLDRLKDIESSLGRVKTVENGPRTIDLDILLFNDRIINEDRLQIPHPRMSEREFVLRPLCDLIPHSFLPQPSSLLDFSAQLSLIPPSAHPISSLVPLTRYAASGSIPSYSKILTADLPYRKTQLMAILNLTPDSFSNDGKHTSNFSPSSLLPQLRSLLHHQIPILDIGGQSTRPHANPLSAQEELARVLPTIQYIRSDPTFNNLLLSIDTYHSSVARACIEAGADIINDVSGGLMDSRMFPTIAELGCTYVLMHMRGTPETMNNLTSYPNGVVDGVANELNERVQKAMEAGIRRWRIILDPGIGFAKTGTQNLELMRRLPELREREGLKGLPWCVGVSRKRFIGRVTGVPGDGGKQEEVEEMKEESGPNYLDTDIESGEKEKWEPTLMREDELQHTDTETRSSERSKTRREKKKKKAAEEGKGNGPPHYHLDIHSNSNTTTTSSSTLGRSYTSSDSDPTTYSDPTTHSNPDTNTNTTNPPSPSSTAVGPEITRIAEPPPSERKTISSGNYDSSTQDPLQPTSQVNHPISNPTSTNISQTPSDTSPPTPQPSPQPDTEMQSRIWGTAAAVTACIQGGADIVRVHDWEEMSKVVRMADAVWRV